MLRRSAGSSLGLAACAIAALTAFASSRAHAQPDPSDLGLLARRSPVQSQGVARAAALTDGRRAHEGAFWKTRRCAVLRDADASAVFDLGSEQPIAAVALQADADDSYLLSISNDGVHFEPLWTAAPVPATGMRLRSSADLHARARYVRLAARGGDGAFAVSELQLFAQVPARFPPELPVGWGVSLDRRLRDHILLFGLALLVPLLLIRRGHKPLWLAAALVLPAIAGAQFVLGLIAAWPIEPREVSLIRATIAAVAAVAIAREALSPPAYPAHRGVVLGCLALCGALGFLAFYNMGRPQFYNPARGRATFAHYFDLRQYYPTAKYFEELGYRRMYDADVAAYLDDHPQRDIGSIAAREMRDLDTLQMSTIGAQRAKIQTVKRRFSPARWEAYKQDARWFRTAMGNGSYFSTLADYGANATPVWLAITRLLFSAVSPSDQAFTLCGLLDAGLLLAAFAAIWISFGARTMWIAMLVFGANDFIMYGTNWGGATLRHDWLAYIAFGACALRKERWVLGGVWLGLATMVRAFPALCVLGACAPALWRAVHARPFSVRTWLARERSTLHTLAGAAGAAVASLALSLTFLPARAWPHWLDKVRALDADPHPASVALKNLIADWDELDAMLLARLPLYLAALVFFSGLLLLATRNKRPDQTALLSLLLLPLYFYPSNYYLHFVFLLPLLANASPGNSVSSNGARIWLCLLLMCSAQYFTVLISDLPTHFYLSTAILFATLPPLLLAVIRQPEQLQSAMAASSTP